ncbi:MAG: EamA family transporter [Verrucomicrobiales bacterium]|nr:EamA family transporter [Verrucomicrobiales bacterium]
MALPPWFFAVSVVLLAWGVVGIFQKLASNHISAESTIIWQSAAFFLFLPFVYPSEPLSRYSTSSLVWGVLSGLLTNLGTLFLVAAMKSGGKASIVAPFCSLYPLIVVIVAPIIFHESLTVLQGAGVGCAVIAIVLLSMEPPKESAGRPLSPEGETLNRKSDV